MIFTFGDSWTAKWQSHKPWPELLNKETKNFANAGASNRQIVDQVCEASLDYPDEDVEAIIIAFTSINRMTLNISVNSELCISQHPDPWYADAQKRVFDDGVTLKNVMEYSLYNFHAIECIAKQTWDCQVHFIPVFEDDDYWRKQAPFLQYSLINLLHFEEKQRYFMYNCPVYELGYLQEPNEFGQAWLDKNCDSNWRKAHFERTDFTMNSALFDNTQHPNQLGHNALAKYFNKFLS